jgi:hypothetical protein
MTPLEYAEEILDRTVSVLLDESLSAPVRRLAQVGSSVILDCETIIVSASDLSEVEISPGCGYVEQSTILVNVVYDCATAFEDDGTTNVAMTHEISQKLDKVGQALKMLADSIKAESVLIRPTHSIAFGIDGGIAYASMQITTGVP